VQAKQDKLENEATLAKKRESALQLELTRTQDELVIAKQQLNQSFADSEEPEELAIKEGFFISAGCLYVRPLIDSDATGKDARAREGVFLLLRVMNWIMKPGFKFHSDIKPLIPQRQYWGHECEY